MSSFVDVLISSFSQLGAVLLVSFLVFGLTKLFSRQKNENSFFDFMGLRRPTHQIDKTFFCILVGSIFFAGASVIVQFHFSPISKALLLSETSPFIKILKSGFGFTQFCSAILYCFVQSGGAEEVLFRGLFARRLFRKFGFQVGNLIQATIFWLMHLMIFKLVTGEWFSWIQLYAFAVSFGLGLVLGFVNHRKGGQSIAPSWLIHGATNLTTYLVLGFIAT
jgi:membrane protease YdiL (CAAX protease family)